VIGLAGDRIRIDSGEVFVNGEALEETTCPRLRRPSGRFSDDRGAGQQLLRAGAIRTMSTTAATLAGQQSANIYGKAVSGIWPMDKMEAVGETFFAV